MDYLIIPWLNKLLKEMVIADLVSKDKNKKDRLTLKKQERFLVDCLEVPTN